MTSFVNINYPAEHAGVARLESAVDAASQVRRGFDSGKGLAALLLAAVVAAMVVVADRLIDSWADGHLLVVWISLWAVAFAALALFAGAAGQLATRLIAGLDAWSRNVARARADIRLWEAAKADPRVMADLRVAMAREETQDEVSTGTSSAASVPAGLTKRAVRLGGAELRAFQRGYLI